MRSFSVSRQASRSRDESCPTTRASTRSLGGLGVARDVVQRAFDWFGREHGFTRRSGDLFKQSEEVVAVLDLQRSDYGRSYYINVGFTLNQLHGGPVSKFGLCDIRLRAEALIDDGEDLPRHLDLENVEIRPPPAPVLAIRPPVRAVPAPAPMAIVPPSGPPALEIALDAFEIRGRAI